MVSIPLLCVLALVIVVDVIVVGGVISICCSADAVLQVSQCRRSAVDFSDQLVDPVHHRADGALGDVLDRRKCRVDCIAECLAGLVSRRKAGGQSGQSGHHQTDGIRFQHRIQRSLRQCKAGCSSFGSRMGSGHGCCVGCMSDFSGGGKGDITLVGQKRRARSGHDRRCNADGLFELGHLLVAVETGRDYLVELYHKVAQCGEQPAGQFTGQGADVIF